MEQSVGKTFYTHTAATWWEWETQLKRKFRQLAALLDYSNDYLPIILLKAFSTLCAW